MAAKWSMSVPSRSKRTVRKRVTLDLLAVNGRKEHENFSFDLAAVR
jgi:hypothetical protein